MTFLSNNDRIEITNFHQHEKKEWEASNFHNNIT